VVKRSELPPTKLLAEPAAPGRVGYFAAWIPHICGLFGSQLSEIIGGEAYPALDPGFDGDVLRPPIGPDQQDQSLSLGRGAVGVPVRVRGRGGEPGDRWWAAGMSNVAADAVAISMGAVAGRTSETKHHRTSEWRACLRWSAHHSGGVS
jgi:hypothetical protein